MFSETTYDEFHQALQTLCDQQIKSLIIDVRDNPGGYMDAVVKIADELVAGQHTIVSTKNKTHADSLMTEFDGLFEKGKVAILVDENSASASEILAGALQDLDRGLVVGRRTYGKGLVQEQFELPDQSAIRITTARYYLPSGRCIQRSYAEGKDRYRHEIIERFSDGKLGNEDSSHQNHKVYLTRDKRKVYSDEGISPDFFVPLDTIYQAKLDPFYTQHIAEQFAQRYYFYHPTEFKTWKTAEQFAGNFQASDSMRQALKQLLVDHKIDPTILAQASLRTEIEQALKVQFARLLFGNNGRYRLLYEQDEFIRKAIQVLDQEHSASRR
jgi:carboxyl-terminal processing protease